MLLYNVDVSNIHQFYCCLLTCIMSIISTLIIIFITFTITIIIIIVTFLFIFFLETPLTGPETDPGVSGTPINCLREVIESATLNPLCYPNSYLAELQSDPLSLLFAAGVWLDSLPQVINNCPNSESLQNDSLST